MADCRAGGFEMMIERTVAFAISENGENGIDLHLVEAESNDPVPGGTILRIVHNPYLGFFTIFLCEVGEMTPFRQSHGFVLADKHPISSEYEAVLKEQGDKTDMIEKDEMTPKEIVDAMHLMRDRGI